MLERTRRDTRGKLSCLHFVQRTRHGETLLHLRRFGTHARVVCQLGHDLRVIQVRFAVHLSRSDAVAARHAAWAPVVRDEPTQTHARF